MQDVFEPTANFEGEVFEPIANFGGELSKEQREEKALRELKNLLQSDKLSQSEKQKIGLAVETGGVFAGLYLASRFLSLYEKTISNRKALKPMNFEGEVFEPMNFEGDYSNFYKVDPNVAIAGGTALVGLIGGASQNKASKNANKTDVQRQIDTICGSRQKFILKSKKNAYESCKNKVLKDLKVSQQQQADLTNKQLDLSKFSLLTSAKDKTDVENELKAKSKKNLIIGLSVGIGVIALGTILFFALRKKQINKLIN